MRPKPTHSNSSSSLHSSGQSPFTGMIGPGTATPMSSSKPKLAKHPTWSTVSSIRHVSSPTIVTTSVASGTALMPSSGSPQLNLDENGAQTSPTIEPVGAITVDDDTPVIPHNENGKRYSRQELLAVWFQMKARGLLNRTPPANFPSLPSAGTGAAKARSTLGSIGGGRATEGSMEYEKFFARTLVPPELYPDTGLSETDSQISPSPPTQIPLSFNDLHGESETRSSSPFLHTPLLPVSTGSSSNGVRSTSAHFPIQGLDESPASTVSPSVQNQPLADSVLSPLTNISLSLPDYASPFSQPVSSTWSPFSGTRTSQLAQVQPQPQQLDHDPFMPSIFGATNEQFSPIPTHHQAFPPPQQQFPPPPPPPGLSLPPILVPAPLIQWVYLDNSGVVQGPFPGPMMHDWYLNQWLTPELMIKRLEENEYYTLAEFKALVGNEIDPFMVALPRAEVDVQQHFQQQQQEQQQTAEKTQEIREELATYEEEKVHVGVDEIVEPEDEELAGITELHTPSPIARVNQEREEPALIPAPEPEPVDEPELKAESGTQHDAGWDVPAVVDNSWGTPTVDNSWAAAQTAPSSSKLSSTTGVNGKHKLQPLPPAPTLVTKIGGESASPVASASPSSTTHTSVPVAPWAKSTMEKKARTQSLKEIEEREARVKKVQEERLQQQQQQQQQLLQRKTADIDLTNGNVVTDDLSGSTAGIPPGLPRSAKWAKTVTVPTVKKTLAQIQKEEEDARQRKAAAAAAAASTTPGVMTAQGRKYAEIMSSKPGTPVGLSRQTPATASSLPAGAWTTIGPGGKKATAPAPANPVTITTVRRTVATPVGTATATRKAGVVKPSVSAEEFFKWCRTTLQGVNSGVNAEELLTMLLSLPLSGTETIEIIADTVYANSTTMDGRRFAEEFVKRRKAVEGNTEALVALAQSSGERTVKSKTDGKASEGWNEVLVKGNAKALKAATTPGGANDGWNSAFKVVGTKKKGKR
ncbi:hypothetical protein V1525DRAFT_346575 [Lipomyces kononenkoae]|uniref:Uncharacterized protein n=1 Tax=Lipomyces kononenkoae TaxID=34357 RepID=A0ACC3SX44_LIPKO